MQLYQPILAYIDARQYVPETTITSYDAAVTSYALASFTNNRPVVEALHHLTTRIFTDFQFKPGFTTIATPVSELMTQKKGVCQDFAHVAIACVRSIGLPARYVSGYIETIPPKGKPKLQGSDASHAWISVYIPEMGWCEFDPTNNLIPSDKHIITAYGRDYADVAPLKGIIFSSGDHKVAVEVDVIRA
jgi:transglutaminase-like putative cysteine protease